MTSFADKRRANEDQRRAVGMEEEWWGSEEYPHAITNGDESWINEFLGRALESEEINN